MVTIASPSCRILPTAEAASYLYAAFSRLYCNWFSLDSYPELA